MRAVLRRASDVAVVLAAGAPLASAQEWSVRGAAATYVLPDEENYVQPTVAVDRSALHLEARYNYEDRNSFSAFIGWNFSAGSKVKLDLTPMFGGVAGDLDGLIPALRLTLAWWKLELYSELEIVFALDDGGDSFFYNWSELGILPVTWLRTGVVAQRTRVYHTPLDTQRGLFVSGTYRFLTLTLYEFNLGWTTPTWVVALSAGF